MIQSSDGVCRLEIDGEKPEHLDQVLKGPMVREAARRLQEIVVVTDHPKSFDLAVFSEIPILKRRLEDGEIRVSFRSLDEELERKLASVSKFHRRTPSQQAAVEAARDQQPHWALGEDGLRSPPIRATDLTPTEMDASPPAGPLVSYLGPRIRPETLRDGDEPLPKGVGERVRAWPIPKLIDRVIVAESANTIGPAIVGFLSSQLGSPPFRIDSGGFGGVGKYLHVHAAVLSPPDGDRPMAIELYGRLASAGRYDFATREGALFLRNRGERQASIPHDDFLFGRDLPGPLLILVRSATYANVLYPGCGVPFYI